MFNCLSKAINVRGCSSTNLPLIYLNSLPGISIKSLDMIANEDKLNYTGVIDSIIQRAGQRILLDFISGAANAKINPKYFNTINCIGRVTEPLVFNNANVTPILQGIKITFKQSQYLSLNLYNLYFRSQVNQNLDFYIIDLVTNDVLDTINVDLIAGDNKIIINKLYYPNPRSTQIGIIYNSLNTGYYNSKNLPCYDECCNECSDHDVIGLCCNDNTIAGYSQGQVSDNTYGLSIEYSIECSYERLLCENINMFLQPLLYACGIEYIYELIGSSRLNKYTTTKKEENEQLLKNFEKRYMQAIEKSVRVINWCDNCCWYCEEMVNYKYVTP